MTLTGATLVTPQGEVQADLTLANGCIVAIGPAPAGEPTLDCTGLHILPGVIDTQVHFREPGLTHKEDLESGTRAAICGGVTTTFEMPNTVPPTTGPEELADKLLRAAGRAWCDYGFFVGATKTNSESLADLEMAPGTPGIKIFMGSSTGSLLVDDDESLRAVLRSGRRPCPVHAEDERRLRERKALISAHPHPREHPFLRDAEAARLATERMIRLSEETGRPVHILHVSTLEELPLIAEAKRRGVKVTCEVTPQHLTLNSEAYETLGTLVQMNPPIRSEEHRLALWRGIEEGLFDVFGSDHAPHTLEEKARPYPESPSGIPGVQTMLPLLLDWHSKGKLSLAQIARMASERPASLYGVSNKGQIAPGFDADLAIVDLNAKWTIEKPWLQSKCGWSPFEGRQLTGRIVHTVLRGELAVRDGELIGTPRGAPATYDWK